MSNYEVMVVALTDLAKKYPDDYNRAVQEVSSILTYTEQAKKKVSDLVWRLVTPGANATYEVVKFAVEEDIEFTMEELLEVSRAGRNWVTLNQNTIIDCLVESFRTEANNV